MKRELSTGQPAAPTDLPLDTNLIEDSFPDPPVEQTQSEPALFNRTAANPSMEMGDEVNRPSTPVDTHSAPEKSDRSSSASSAAVYATRYCCFAQSHCISTACHAREYQHGKC